MKNRRGNAVIEVAMWIPFLLLLIGGTIQFGRIMYLNYAIQKIVYTAARNLSVQQNLNLCDSADTVVQTVLTDAVTDPSTGQPLVLNLTGEMLTVTTRCVTNGTLGDCSTSGCGGVTGAQRPDYITVTLTDGYTVPLRIPFMLRNPIVLRPSITVPFGGSKL